MFNKYVLFFTTIIFVQFFPSFVKADAVEECAKVAEPFANDRIYPADGVYENRLFKSPTVTFEANGITCTLDKAANVQQLTIAGETLIQDGWVSEESRDLYESLTALSDEEILRLETLSVVLAVIPDNLQGHSIKLQERQAYDLAELRGKLLQPTPDVDALRAEYLPRFLAPNLDLEIAEYLVGLRSVLRDLMTTGVEIPSPVIDNLTIELTKECEKLAQARVIWREHPEAGPTIDQVSKYEQIYSTVSLARPALLPLGFDFEQHGGIALALMLSGVFREQAAQGEELEDPLAHERAAYEWGYSVGDPEAVRRIRFLSEGLQLGVFSAEALEPFLGDFARHLDSVQKLLGDFGSGYEINFDYLEDAFKDVEISKDGSIEGQIGNRSGVTFERYWLTRNRCAR